MQCGTLPSPCLFGGGVGSQAFHCLSILPQDCSIGVHWIFPKMTSDPVYRYPCGQAINQNHLHCSLSPRLNNPEASQKSILSLYILNVIMLGNNVKITWNTMNKVKETSWMPRDRNMKQKWHQSQERREKRPDVRTKQCLTFPSYHERVVIGYHSPISSRSTCQWPPQHPTILFWRFTLLCPPRKWQPRGIGESNCLAKRKKGEEDTYSVFPMDDVWYLRW
jgi:hypothetical protein